MTLKFSIHYNPLKMLENVFEVWVAKSQKEKTDLMIIPPADGAPCGSTSFLVSLPFLISPTFPSISLANKLGQWQLEYPQRKEEDCQSAIKCWRRLTKRSQ